MLITVTVIVVVFFSGQYFASTMVLISISLAMSVGVLNMHHIGPDFAPVPPWMKKHILGTLANWLWMTNKDPPGQKKKNVTGERLAQDFRTWEQQELLSIVQSQVQNSPRIRQRSYIPCNGVALGPDLSEERQSSCPQEHGSTSSISTPITRQNDVLKELLREVRKLTNHIEEDKTDNKIKDEWKRVALVLDRFFFFFFVIGTFGTYLIMFCQMWQETFMHACTPIINSTSKSTTPFCNRIADISIVIDCL